MCHFSLLNERKPRQFSPWVSVNVKFKASRRKLILGMIYTFTDIIGGYDMCVFVELLWTFKEEKAHFVQNILKIRTYASIMWECQQQTVTLSLWKCIGIKAYMWICLPSCMHIGHAWTHLQSPKNSFAWMVACIHVFTEQMQLCSPCVLRIYRSTKSPLRIPTNHFASVWWHTSCLCYK